MYSTNYHFYNTKNHLYTKPVKGLQGCGIVYRFAFNGKELDKGDEGMGGGGSTYDYGFRIYNPNLGRFLSLDPIAKEFPWNSPFSYAENDVIRSIDLDGLEKVVVVMDQKPGKTEFEANVTYLETQSYTIIRVATGADIIKGLEKYTIDGGKPIENLVILAHASAGGIYGINGKNNGLYTPGTIQYVAESVDGVTPNSELTAKNRKDGAASICDIETSIKQKSIVFADGAVILFGGCNAGAKNTDGSPGIAEATAQELSITTIGAKSSTWDGGKIKVPGDTDNKDLKCSTRSNRLAPEGWNMFTPESDGSVTITALSTGGADGGKQPMNVTGCTLR